MPEKKSAALRRRILPFTELNLMLEEQGGAFYRVELRLAFDMNAGAAIQERTADPKMEFRGYMLTELSTWAHIGEPNLLKAMLWGSMLAHQPEYNCDEGFETVGTFIQENNAQQIIDAVEKAYFKYLPKDRVEAILKMKEKAETKGAGGETKSPLAETETAPSGTSSSELIGSSSGPSVDTTSASPSPNSAS